MNKDFLCGRRRWAQNVHVDFLTRGLMNGLKQEEEELVTVVAHLGGELLVECIMNGGLKTFPESSWPHTLSLVTFPEKLYNLCKGGCDVLKLLTASCWGLVEESIVFPFLHNPDEL